MSTSTRKKTFGKNAIDFYKTTAPPNKLPKGVSALNPYESDAVQSAVQSFYTKYFNDAKKRIFLIGINPGRLGAGVTGIPFTDTPALERCGIKNAIPETKELSAEYVYRVIDAYGGAEKFYRTFFVTSICPFGFIKDKVNMNYYDTAELQRTLVSYIQETFETQLQLGAVRCAVVLGKGKNYNFIQKMNDEHSWFDEIIPLDHPRFIMQYRRKSVDDYIKQHIETLRSVAQRQDK